MMRKLLSPIGLMVFVSLCVIFGPHGAGNLALGDIASAPDADYSWTAPEYGTPVDHYVVQILVNDLDMTTLDPIPSAFVRVQVVYGNKYMVRVAAVDAAGIQGGFSPWSIPYTPELAPPEF